MQTEKAKSSHFDRTRGFKNQIFPTIAYIHRVLPTFILFGVKIGENVDLMPFHRSPSANHIFLNQILSDK